MGERWNAEAEDLKPTGTPGRMDGGAPRVTLHVTVSKPGSFDAMHRVLTNAKAEPHFLYDPATDRLGQYFPCDVSARALKNDGDRRTNGHGSVNIQIEVCAMPDGNWKPGPNWAALLRTIRSWGVPDVWPAGRLSKNYADNVDRSWASYSKAGWFGHCNVPGNDHWDPGPINQQGLFLTTKPQQASYTEEVGLAAEDVKKVNDYTRALLLDGYTVAGTEKPSILDVLVNIQGRFNALSKALQPAALAAAFKAALPADAGAVDVDELARRVVLELGKD